MKVTKTMLRGIIKRVKASVSDMHSHKLKLAKDLLWAKNVIHWRYTFYKSWDKFCKSELPMGVGTIDAYVYVARSVEKFGYTDAQCQQMIDALGWTRFKLGLIDMPRKLSVKRFIETYKGFSTTGGGAASKDGDVHYAFSIPRRQAAKLNVVLKAYGMAVGKSGRTGLRKAMVKLVNRKL